MKPAEQARIWNDSKARRRGLWALSGAALALTLFGAPASAQPAQACGSLSNGQNGPFDYRVERGRKLAVVEEFHFTSKVENLLAGQSGELGQDLDYTLRAFPNHHRALLAMARFAKRAKRDTAPHAAFTVDCYFERALRFKADDTTARLLYANFLNENGRKEEAAKQVSVAVEQAPDNPFTQYNAGLIFADLGLFDRALKQAHIAMAAGFLRSELKDRLVAAGKWVEPAEIQSGESAASAAAAPFR